jgi:hypothetical protein
MKAFKGQLVQSPSYNLLLYLKISIFMPPAKMIPQTSTQMITMKMAVFWVVAPCSLVEVYQHFRGTCCFQHQGDEVASTCEMLVNFHQNTWHYNSEDSHFHAHHHKNLRFYQAIKLLEFCHIS